MHNTDLYFECHVNTEPLDDQRKEVFRKICTRYDFHVAKLLLQKGVASEDGFATSRGEVYYEVYWRMYTLIKEALAAGFEIRRYKIENTLMDSRIADVYGLLDPKWTAPVLIGPPRDTGDEGPLYED